MKKTYSAPSLTVEGSVEALTAQIDKTSNHLDATFPPGTPRGKLTFS